MTYKTFRRICTAILIFLALMLEVKAQNIPIYGNLVPSDSGALDLGSPSLHWDTIFVDAIHPPVSGSGIWYEINDSTIGWNYGTDSLIIYNVNGDIGIVKPNGSGLEIDASSHINLQGVGVYVLEGSDLQQAQLNLREDEDNGLNSVVLQPPASLAANYTLTLPSNDGNANEVLTTNGSGVTSWTPAVWADESTSPSDSIISWTTYDGEKIIIEKDYEDYFIRTNDNSEGIAVGNENRARLYVDNLNKRTQLLSGTTEDITLDGNQKFFAVTINDSVRFWIDSTGKVIVVGTTDSYALPTNDGNANEVLTTNGSGVTSWRALQDTTWEFIANNDMYFQSASGQFHIYDLGSDVYSIVSSGNLTELTLNDNNITTTETFLPADSALRNLGSDALRWSDGYINSVTTYSIIDEGSTVNTTAGDAATINAISGRFRKDATGATFTVTNSYITPNSIVVVTPANTAIDATATTWTVDVSGGNILVTFNAAPTANFDMNFIVIN